MKTTKNLLFVALLLIAAASKVKACDAGQEERITMVWCYYFSCWIQTECVQQPTGGGLRGDLAVPSFAVKPRKREEVFTV